MDLGFFLADAALVCESLGSNYGRAGVIVNIIGSLITTIKIAVPLLLIIFGMVDLIKGVTARDEEKMKEGQRSFFRRLIPAILVFLVVTIVQFVVGIVGGETDNACLRCALGESKCSITATGYSNSATSNLLKSSGDAACDKKCANNDLHAIRKCNTGEPKGMNAKIEGDVCVCYY